MIPYKNKKQSRNNPTTISTDKVVDRYGRSLTTLQNKQKWIDRDQRNKTRVAQQHATRSDGSDNDQKLIFRDVFPYKKYTLTFNTGQWLNVSGASATVGYTLDGEFYQVVVVTSRPEHREVEVDLTSVADLETVEVILVGAPENISGYLEDCSSAADLQSQIDDLVERIEALEEAVGIPYSGTNSLDERVTDLET